MNIKLKSEILEKSIHIESYLSQILMRLLDIENLNNKTFGTKGSALSFKSKADLLYDIKKIDKNLYNDLILFMEIRNQFIHNLDTNSFETVNSRINKKTRLLQLYDEFDKHKEFGLMLKEDKLYKGFIFLCIRIIQNLETTENKILEEKKAALDRQIEVIEKNHELEFKKLTNKALADSIDEVMEVLNESFKKNELGEKFNAGNRFTDLIKTSIFGLLKKNIAKEIDKQNKKTRANK
ncbi:hypothetical protein DET49_104113 [Salegentibacter sp. 24]|uniref:hypothetical protein n=1 Tax=Salegentibacter sp. 24 TaxID=2183986 RepID=UPI00105C30DD|nr:hypothetical protein [Salegentibacter sp. 24]TDN93387.1 hypothetical protein DET49_104113 [Salegentibacter sp. 24]